MNYSRAESLEAPLHEPEYVLNDNDNVERFERSTRRTRKLDRVAARTERDRARGYSINVKQVVLAFAIEFFIIAIVLVGQVYLVQGAADDWHKIIPAMLFPLALAVIELARVPLAISVRTAQSWNIQLAALLGVCCAVVVTSLSLYQIGDKSFSQRLEAVNAKRAALEDVRSRQKQFADWRADADTAIQKMRTDRDNLAERYRSLTVAMNQMIAQNCTQTVRTDQSGNELRGQSCKVNPLLKTMQTEHADAKQKLQDANTSVANAEDGLRKQLANDVGTREQAMRKAEAEYRAAIFQSPMHGYTGMLFGKDPAEVTEGEVKTLQRYLIGLPSIAAALASTLIAMAAVRRIPRRDPDEPVRLPDEAVAYLFGPLVNAIRAEADSAVKAALSSNASNSAQGPPPSAGPKGT
jgi:hypothetical protein